MNALRKLSPIHVITHAITGVALLSVILTLSPVLGSAVGLTGRAAWAVGTLLAAVADTLWLTVVRVADRAVKARQYGRASVMGAVALIFATASAAMVLSLGHGGVLAAMPLASLAMNGVRLAVDNGFTDAGTARAISDSFAAERNATATARAAITLAGIERDRLAGKEVADAADAARRELAVARQAVATDNELDAEFAKLHRSRQDSRAEHGADADAFRAWFATQALGQRTAPPVLGPVELVPTVSGLAVSRPAAIEVTDVANLPEGVPARFYGETAGTDQDGSDTDRFTPGSAPVLNDAQLLAEGRRVWLTLGRPKTQRGFLRAMADVPGARGRKVTVFKILSADAIADATDMVADTSE
mgnify:CR=1 FL=1